VNYTYDNLNETIVITEDEDAAAMLDSIRNNTVKPQ